jgi:hypothetical protein
MSRAAAVPVLTWHSMYVAGASYETNDHVRLREDLAALHAAGAQIVSLREIARALVAGHLDELRGCVGLSFDDAPDFDFLDVPHSARGTQRSMANVLADFRARHGDAQPRLHATSFAIVSPEARAELDATCMLGLGWWNDAWWKDAEATGLISVESHGWDHNHEGLRHSVATAPRGTFDLATRADADAEIAQASRFLRQRRGRDGDVLFAYPYGPASDYLVNEYFPDATAQHGVYAAFSGGSEPVVPTSSRWRIPRYFAGGDWKSPGELIKLLSAAGFEGRRPGATQGAVARTPQRRTWREHLKTWEVDDPRALAGELFQRSFGHPAPDYPRHFVLVYSPPPEESDTTPRVVAYVHQSPFEEVFLTGGMCVDAATYRRFPKWLYEAVRREGGLATIVTRDSIAILGPPAVFGLVGEPRSRASVLRTGFVDTGRPHLMAVWCSPLTDHEKARLVERVAALGPF